MSNSINESNLKGQVHDEVSNGKVNNGGSESSSKRNKLKRSRSDTRKSHRSKSSSRKSKNSHKAADKHHKRESRDVGDRSHRSSSPLAQVKDEYLSDDQNSSVSDNKPLLLTRSRIRRIARRKAFSSNSSALESDNRKAKSEPIIITLGDSESDDDDDNVSVVSNRPNRTARIKGEIIRKLSRSANTKINSYKTSDTPSSSDCESSKQKKKSKYKSAKTSCSSQASKRKRYLVNRLACKSRLKLRKHHRKPHISHVYRPKKKKDLKKIKKCFEEQRKEEKVDSKTPLVKKSPQAVTLTERRTLRSTSTDVSQDSATKVENLTESPKISDECKPRANTEKSPLVEKKSECVVSKKQSKKEEKLTSPEDKSNLENSPLSTNEESSKLDETLQSVEVDEAVKPAEMDETIKPVEMDETVNPSTVDETVKPVKMDKGDSPPEDNTEHVLDQEDKSILGSASAELASNTEEDPTSGGDQEMQNTVTESGAKPSEAALPEKKIHKSNSVVTPKKLKNLKKKVKPVDRIIRKRGRPRLSDMKPVKSIPILNDVIQLPFLQNTFCFNIAPKLPKCRECRILVNRSARSMLHSYCRFMEYRKLCYSKTGLILNAGFSEPSEATPEHLGQWLPQLDDPPKDLNFNTSKSLVEHIGDQFCDLVEQEREALSLHIGIESVITWKRIVQGVREMCDVCYTTLFNIHWVCPVCGLAVCIDCYKGRLQGITVEYEDGQPKNRDQYNWLVCSLKQPHDPKDLVMAQIIPGHALWTMRDLLHKARKQWNIPSYCKCIPQEIASSDKCISTGICKQLMCFVTKSFSTERSSLYFSNESNMQNGESNYDDLDIEVSGSALKWLEGSYVSNLDGIKSTDDFCNSYEDFASLRGNLLNGSSNEDNSPESERELSSFSLDDIIACVTKSQNSENKENSGKSVIKHFTNRYPQPNSGRDPLPIRIYTKLESSLAFMNVPHSWFCNGRLLFLLQSDHPDNLALFQEQWKRGQPILVKGVDDRLSKDLWHPDAFCRDFGEIKNDLVDCRTGAIMKSVPMRKFWEGFESFAKRMKNDIGEYLLLKLKDWPPGEDFSEMLPDRFDDLMSGLPLPEYTHRDGILNLAGRLPSWFVRPDLGPKMYNAYGSALYPTKGTTNLHLDISDAVNVMVYVGIPQDGNAQLHIEEALKAIDEGGCDSLMRARVRARGAKPGALWHIYNARDADKIRELLTKVAMERGEKLEAHHDPIHDQSWYLDAELRKRLYRDYGVEGYAIAQCLGDAVFIPAGAPHQVRNLHSCVKVAEDFVSPENIAHCFKLTQEFRHLSDTHTNHEDKLQIKNIIYHVVRDSLAHLLADSDSAES